MSQIKELRNNIAVSLYLGPCTTEELKQREFLKNKSMYGIELMCQQLEKDGGLFFEGEVMKIKKAWAKINLTGYELDFRTDKEKSLDGMTDFAKSVLCNRCR